MTDKCKIKSDKEKVMREYEKLAEDTPDGGVKIVDLRNRAKLGNCFDRTVLSLNMAKPVGLQLVEHDSPRTVRPEELVTEFDDFFSPPRSKSYHVVVRWPRSGS